MVEELVPDQDLAVVVLVLVLVGGYRTVKGMVLVVKLAVRSTTGKGMVQVLVQAQILVLHHQKVKEMMAKETVPVPNQVAD